jgi:hypothetical protein
MPIHADDDALLVARDKDESGRLVDAIIEDVGSDRIVGDDEFSFCHWILEPAAARLCACRGRDSEPLFIRST